MIKGKGFSTLIPEEEQTEFIDSVEIQYYKGFLRRYAVCTERKILIVGWTETSVRMKMLSELFSVRKHIKNSSR